MVHYSGSWWSVVYYVTLECTMVDVVYILSISLVLSFTSVLVPRKTNPTGRETLLTIKQHAKIVSEIQNQG